VNKANIKAWFWGFIFMLCLLAITRIYLFEAFKRNCSWHLALAAESANIELATRHIELALKYIDANELNVGYTSLIYKTPNEDVGFWRENIAASLAELKQVKPETGQYERTTILLKLGSNLTSRGAWGSTVTAPQGTSIFPYNWLFAFWATVSTVGAIFFGFLWIRQDDTY
jgi:hypothetical protein